MQTNSKTAVWKRMKRGGKRHHEKSGITVKNRLDARDYRRCLRIVGYR